MKLDEATRRQVECLRDELLNPVIPYRRVVEILSVLAALRPGLVEQIAEDYMEYKRNRKRLLRALPLDSTTAAVPHLCTIRRQRAPGVDWGRALL